MSRWIERFHEYISGLRVSRVIVPTPSPMKVISPSERSGGVRMPCGYGSDSVAFLVAQPHVHRQLVRHLPVVLNKESTVSRARKGFRIDMEIRTVAPAEEH